MKPASWLRVVGLGVLCGVGCCRAEVDAGPSFDCAKVHSQVNRMICASPELSALDRKLAADFDNTKHQGGIDGRQLQQDEDRWLATVRNRCDDEACLRRAYRQRDATLLDRSLYAASPAAYQQTRPFAVDPALLADARSFLGQPCSGSEDLPATAGYQPVAGYLPVIHAEGVALPRSKNGALFVFLLDTRNGGCRIAEVVSLPGRDEAASFLQCAVPADDGTAAPQSAGFGLRRKGQKSPLAYWEMDGSAAKLVRQPLDVLGWGDTIRCQQPETGE